MPVSKNKKLVLESHKEEVEAIVKASVNGYPLVNRELKKILQNIINLKFYEENIGIDDLKTFLIEESRLHKIAFQTPRTETLYVHRVEFGLSGVLEQHLEGNLVRNTFHQILQFFCFPAIQTVIVDFHNAFQMADPKGKFLLQFHDLGEHFLVVQPRIAHKTYLSPFI